MYETTDVLSVRISTCRCSRCGRKSFRAKNTASSSKRFMCHRLWGSDHSSEADMPSHTAPQPRLDASVITTTRDVTKPRGTPRLKRSGLRHGHRASMQPRETAMLRRPEVHAVQGTWDFSHNCSGRMCSKPRWHTAEADAMSPSSLWNSFKRTELPSLKWRREDKMSLHWVEAHSQICYRLTRGENALLHVDT